jgi:hypothetical protein
VAPLPAGTDALSTSLEEVALQSPVNKSAGFSTAEPPGTPFLAGNAAADPLDGKTVLVGTPVMGVNLWGGSPLCDSGSLSRISIPNDLLRSSKHEARATAVRATGRGEEACGCVA